MQFSLATFLPPPLVFATGKGAMTVDQFVQTMLGGLAIGCIYSLIALGISMIIRATDILHFAQGEMLMIGSMMGLSAFWLQGMPFGFVLLAGILGGGLSVWWACLHADRVCCLSHVAPAPGIAD